MASLGNLLRARLEAFKSPGILDSSVVKGLPNMYQAWF